MSIVTCRSNAERRTCPTRATTSALTTPIADSIPASASGPNRRASPPAVRDGGVGTASNR